MNTISKYFEDDHDRLDEIFRNFQFYKYQDFPRSRENFVSFKFGLQRHIIWEEEVLFPAFEKATGITQGPTEVMRREHKLIGEYLEAIHQKVKEGNPATEEEENLLLSVLGPHNDKEENILYPAIDSLLSDTDRAMVFEAMRNIPEERYLYCCKSA